ncbi:MAG: helix-turn-helix domain-containing protein [Eubacteriales bacterium]
MDNREYTKALKNYPMALNVKEVSEILRISTKLVYRLIKNGTILSVKIGRENRIPKTDLITYMRGFRTYNMS